METDESLIEELSAQLEEGHKAQFILELDDEQKSLPPGNYNLYVTDVKFEDNYVNVKLRME